MKKIIKYNPQLKQHFVSLNLQWLNELFTVEEYDKEILNDCENKILAKGGEIFFLQQEDEIVGTYALIPLPNSNGSYEFTKMAVLLKERGKGYGKFLMEHAIQFAKQNQFPSLILYSSTTLGNAIHIYRKYGFVEIPIEKDCSYERCNIKMELTINKQES